MKFPLIGQAYTNRSLAISAQECTNLYPEMVEAEGRSVASLHGTPGLKSPLATPGNGPIRGMKVMGSLLYVVSGTELYSVTTAGTSTLIGTIAGSNRVSMEVNGATTQELCIVNGSQGYVYDTTNGLQSITSANFYAADRVDFINGYFLFNHTGTDAFFCSNIDTTDGNALVYTATDYSSVDTRPGNIISLLVDHDEVWLFKEDTTEVWYDEPGTGSDFPFSKISSAFIERGCGAVHSPSKIDNTIFWLGEDLIVYRADGYNTKRISTHAIEYAIKGYSTTSDAFSFVYSDEGHKFYVLTFPSGGTWVYDVSTGGWHERKSFGLSRWRANCYEYFNNKHYVGDYSNSNIYEMDLDTYTENGTTIQRIRSTTYIHAESSPVFMDWLQIVIESGAGLTSGQGSDPQAMLQYSDDGGRTWSSEKWSAMGKIGEYFRRVRWTQLGRFYQRVFRVTITDPIKVVLVEADTNLDKGLD